MKLSTLLILLSLVYNTLCAPELVRRTYKFRKSSPHLRASADTYNDSKDYLNPRQLQDPGQNDTNSGDLNDNWLLTNTSDLPPLEPGSGIMGKRGKHITQILRTRATKRSVISGPKFRSASAKYLNVAARSKGSIQPDKVKQALNTAPTPQPTTAGSVLTTVHINDEDDFALLLPKNPNELIGDAETDGVAFCTAPGCTYTLPEGFITAAAVTRSPDNSSWIQITGCLETSKLPLSATDDGGQFDVRFPDGAQCTFGGYGASFIEQVEPSANRFCMRCCSEANDQINCNSHQDRSGCPTAIPGIYDFPEKGVSCA